MMTVTRAMRRSSTASGTTTRMMTTIVTGPLDRRPLIVATANRRGHAPDLRTAGAPPARVVATAASPQFPLPSMPCRNAARVTRVITGAHLVLPHLPLRVTIPVDTPPTSPVLIVTSKLSRMLLVIQHMIHASIHQSHIKLTTVVSLSAGHLGAMISRTGRDPGILRLARTSGK